MEQTINYISLLVIFFFIFFILMMVRNWFKFYKVKAQIKDFTNYLTVLEYHMSKAYELIYKDRILVYSLEATRVPDNEFNKITQDFVKLVIKFIGSSLYSSFCDLYGSEETFIFNLAEYFNNKYEEDSIRKQTMDEISSDDTSSQEELKYE